MEIEKLQTRSTTLNMRLNNRQAVEVLLGPAVERFGISPGTIRKVAEGTMDEEWIVAMVDVQNRVEFVETAVTGEGHVRALDDLKPLYTDVINKVCSIHCGRTIREGDQDSGLGENQRSSGCIHQGAEVSQRQCSDDTTIGLPPVQGSLQIPKAASSQAGRGDCASIHPHDAMVLP